MNNNPYPPNTAQPGYQPPTPATPPATPQRYLHGGKLLAILAALYALGLWFVFAGAFDNPLHSSGSFVVLAISLALFAIDWRGYTSLAGLIKWRQIPVWARVGVGCLFLLFFPFVPVIYFIRAIQQHYKATRQSPIGQIKRFFAAFSKRTLRAQLGIVSGILASVLVFSVLTAVAAAGGQPSNLNQTSTLSGDTTSTTISQSDILVGTVSPQPEATPEATATAGPTATPQPTATPTPRPTPTPAPSWKTIKTFKGNGIKKTPAFDVPDHWRLVWSCNPASEYFGSYNVIVEVKDAASDYPIDFAVNTICKKGNTGDSTEEYQGGTVYLDVNSEAAWTLKVQIFK